MSAGHHHHSHGGLPSERGANRKRLGAALGITLAFFLAEVVGALISGSLALLADAAHMFTDLAALILAFAANTLAERSSSKRYTFGFYRAEILAAFINAQLLLLIGAYILYQAYRRLLAPAAVDTDVMLWVAAAGLVANLVALSILRGGSGSSLNLRAAYLEVFSDTLGSLAVIAVALLIPLTGWQWLDPILSVAIALFVLPRAVSILRESAHVLLEGTPQHIDLNLLKSRLAAIPGVEGVHDFHFWTLTSGLDSASVHVRIKPDTERFSVRRQVENLLRESVRVQHITVQVEEAGETACSSIAAHR